jgi:hypothetical protein
MRESNNPFSQSRETFCACEWRAVKGNFYTSYFLVTLYTFSEKDYIYGAYLTYYE